MTAALPSTAPPPQLASKALPILLQRLAKSKTPSTAPDVGLLKSCLRTIVTLRLSRRPIPPSATALLPLQKLHDLPSDTLDTPPLLDAILAYPDYSPSIHDLLDRAFSSPSCTFLDDVRNTILPGFLQRLRLDPSRQSLWTVSYILLCLVRAHEELLGLLLSEADSILLALRQAYSPPAARGNRANDEVDEVQIEAKANTLLVCRALEGAVSGMAKEGMPRLIHGDSSSTASGSRDGGHARGGLEGFLLDNTLGEDFDILVSPSGGGAGMKSEVWQVLESLRESEAREDPMVLPLFPSLPPHLLSTALSHPAFSSSAEPASVLIDNILTGGSSLPAELNELRMAVTEMSDQQSSALPPSSAAASRSTPSTSRPGPAERANIFDSAPMDFSRLHLGKSDSATPAVGEAIPDHLRESILRLVESQKAEAEAEARAVAEAWGTRYVPPGGHEEEGAYEEGDEYDSEEGGPRLNVRREGDESGDEEDGENVVEQIRDPRKVGQHDIDHQTYLEQRYLAEPRLFDRDAATRRSMARRELREVTGMDDGQLEGWRVMLERNEAILARHTFVPKAASLKIPLSSEGGSTRTGLLSETGSVRSGSSSGGRGSNRGGSRGVGGGGGRGRGGGSGGGSRTPSEAGTYSSRGEFGGGGGGEGRGRGGGGGGRGGGGRGRGENKGSRGHSNAARTRGHDRKMAKMGMGA